MNTIGAERIIAELTITINLDGYKLLKHPKCGDPGYEFHCEAHTFRAHECSPTCEYRRPEQYMELYERLRRKYGEPIGEGRHRTTFASNCVVIKIPRNNSALIATQSEYRRYKRKDPSESDRLARCRMVTMNDLPVIIMEKLDTSTDYRDKPDWSWQYDTGQVGKDRKGNFKAYDYTTC